MIIGVDIDGVLTNLLKLCKKDFFQFSKKINGKGIFRKQARSLAEIFGVTQEQDYEFWKDYNWVYAENIKYYPTASKYLKKLRERGHKIYIITSREYAGQNSELGQKMRTLIETSLQKEGILYDKIFYTSETKSKKQVIVDNNVDVLIDDSFWNLEEATKLIPAICFDQIYNRDYKNERVERCKNWREIYKTIQKMAKKEN